MADTNGDTFWKWATGILIAAVGYLWRALVKKDNSLIREKEARIRDRDRHIARLEDVDRKARENKRAGSKARATRNGGKGSESDGEQNT